MNKQTKHTPGPWSVDRSGEGVIDERGFAIAEAANMGVLDNWESTGVVHWSRKPGVTFIERSEEEMLANARLLAAAPDLLKACQAFCDLFCDCDMRPEDECYEVFAYCRAAIGKALPSEQL